MTGADGGGSGRLARLRRRAEALAGEVQVVGLAARDPRTGWLPRIVVALVVAYVLSPIDPIPDVLPVIGLLDGLVVVPIGVALAIRLTPPAALADARARFAAGERVATRAGVALVVTLWLVSAVAAAVVVRRLT